MVSYKQIIIARKDLKLPPGKLAAQVAHAAVQACFAANKQLVKKWMDQGMKKIVLQVATEQELLSFAKQAEDAGITTAVITDAGHTVVAPGTITCVALGPAPEEHVDKITAALDAY
ncbi:MAG: peptidyl-tRNA hydrolase Pth2 [archaeon]